MPHAVLKLLENMPMPWEQVMIITFLCFTEAQSAPQLVRYPTGIVGLIVVIRSSEVFLLNGIHSNAVSLTTQVV